MIDPNKEFWTRENPKQITGERLAALLRGSWVPSDDSPEEVETFREWWRKLPTLTVHNAACKDPDAVYRAVCIASSPIYALHIYNQAMRCIRSDKTNHFLKALSDIKRKLADCQEKLDAAQRDIESQQQTILRLKAEVYDLTHDRW